MEKKNFENIRQMRTRLKTAKDDALVNLSAMAMTSIKNVLRLSKGSAQTAAYHIIAQKYENLDAALKRLNESTQFLGESQGALKREWEVFVAEDADRTRKALFTLLTYCESLDKDDIAKRINSESQTFSKIKDDLEKIKNASAKSCEEFAKLSNEFELSLRTFDSILNSTEHSVSEFDAYSKFSSALEDLDERIRRLNESLKFFEDEYTREDWKCFMELDLKMLKKSIRTSYNSSMQLVNVVAQKERG